MSEAPTIPYVPGVGGRIYVNIDVSRAGLANGYLQPSGIYNERPILNWRHQNKDGVYGPLQTATGTVRVYGSQGGRSERWELTLTLKANQPAAHKFYPDEGTHNFATVSADFWYRTVDLSKLAAGLGPYYCTGLRHTQLGNPLDVQHISVVQFCEVLDPAFAMETDETSLYGGFDDHRHDVLEMGFSVPDAMRYGLLPPPPEVDPETGELFPPALFGRGLDFSQWANAPVVVEERVGLPGGRESASEIERFMVKRAELLGWIDVPGTGFLEQSEEHLVNLLAKAWGILPLEYFHLDPPSAAGLANAVGWSATVLEHVPTQISSVQVPAAALAARQFSEFLRTDAGEWAVSLAVITGAGVAVIPAKLGFKLGVAAVSWTLKTMLKRVEDGQIPVVSQDALREFGEPTSDLWKRMVEADAGLLEDLEISVSLGIRRMVASLLVLEESYGTRTPNDGASLSTESGKVGKGLLSALGGSAGADEPGGADDTVAGG